VVTLSEQYPTNRLITDAEWKLILRLRQSRGMAIVDSDSMTLWVAGKPEQCNGKRTQYGESVLPFEMIT